MPRPDAQIVEAFRRKWYKHQHDTFGAEIFSSHPRGELRSHAVERRAGGCATAGPARPVAALEELVQAYWFPLYAFARRQGEPPATAEDMVQGFFAVLLEKKYLAQVDRSKGRFRSFLLAALRHYMSKQRARGRALKRGGGVRVIALDGLDAEKRYAVEPADNADARADVRSPVGPGRAGPGAGRGWRAEYASAGKARLYAAIEPCLTGAGPSTMPQLPRELKMTEGALRTAAASPPPAVPRSASRRNRRNGRVVRTGGG